ncbi:hypothetical protein Poly30_09770 [Planctomycetes bacterium Poly30]|uniref:Uncharacterized protein n=1 Tax=Saltatorellus ferox TaxID=2528018 RepID=A0A518EN18_9BACT|nr:hypothetical protein Poly30_09770 [Planctomycetes bacterium Poly30]
MFTRSLFIAGGTLLLAGSGVAQNRYVFSVNWHGPTVGAIAPSGVAITEGDLLYPTTGTSNPELGPLPTPTIAIDHASVLGLPPICVGHPGGTPCIVEVDAFSRGNDHRFMPNVPIQPGDILFSVDEFARGFAFGAGPFPNLTSEAMAREAATDAFTNLVGLPPGPVSPFPGRNIGVIDGDGLPSASGYAYPGVGAIEPNTPFGGLPDTGDNQDAIDLVEPLSTIVREYFSLDSGFLDPLEGVPNSSSAAANGFVGGDILVAAAGGPALFAPAFALGLDVVGGPDSDDLDALILFENGNGIYDPVTGPYSWAGGATDMVIFSVRRGSAIIGVPDSLLGLPIEEGDLLIPPPPGAATPGIFIAAECLGLATLRAGTGNFGDDLTAADSIMSNVHDCDGDGVEDAVAIAFGMVADLNMNGVPDPCEGCPSVGVPFCFCPTVLAPCGNADAAAGCLNVAGTGALLSGCGSASVSADDLVLTTTGMTPGGFALTFMGSGVIFPANIGNGLLCLAGPLYRFPPYGTGSGTASVGPGLVAYTLANNPPPGQITAGSTWNFQTYYRDIGGPCGAFFNLSSALGVVFTP